MLKEVLNWKREGKGILGWPRSFLSWPIKTQSSQFERKWERKLCKTFWKKCPFKPTVCVRACLCFLFVFNSTRAWALFLIAMLLFFFFWYGCFAFLFINWAWLVFFGWVFFFLGGHDLFLINLVWLFFFFFFLFYCLFF